jgi:hypothetical protein
MMDGKSVVDNRTIKEAVQARQVGDSLPLTVWRGGQTLELNLVLEEMPDDYGRFNARRRGRGGPYYMPQPEGPEG